MGSVLPLCFQLAAPIGSQRSSPHRSFLHRVCAAAADPPINNHLTIDNVNKHTAASLIPPTPPVSVPAAHTHSPTIPNSVTATGEVKPVESKQATNITPRTATAEEAKRSKLLSTFKLPPPVTHIPHNPIGGASEADPWSLYGCPWDKGKKSMGPFAKVKTFSDLPNQASNNNEIQDNGNGSSTIKPSVATDNRASAAAHRDDSSQPSANVNGNQVGSARPLKSETSDPQHPGKSSL